MRVILTARSGNAKTGPIPVSTTSKDSCPPECPLLESGCYAGAGGPLAIIWNVVSRATERRPHVSLPRGGTLRTLAWATFCAAIRAMPLGTLWRHNQAGDLPGHGSAIDTEALR